MYTRTHFLDVSRRMPNYLRTSSFLLILKTKATSLNAANLQEFDLRNRARTFEERATFQTKLINANFEAKINAAIYRIN